MDVSSEGFLDFVPAQMMRHFEDDPAAAAVPAWALAAGIASQSLECFRRAEGPRYRQGLS